MLRAAPRRSLPVIPGFALDHRVIPRNRERAWCRRARSCACVPLRRGRPIEVPSTSIGRSENLTPGLHGGALQVNPILVGLTLEAVDEEFRGQTEDGGDYQAERGRTEIEHLLKQRNRATARAGFGDAQHRTVDRGV